jgi:hypothetical protein
MSRWTKLRASAFLAVTLLALGSVTHAEDDAEFLKLLSGAAKLVERADPAKPFLHEDSNFRLLQSGADKHLGPALTWLSKNVPTINEMYALGHAFQNLPDQMFAIWIVAVAKRVEQTGADRRILELAVSSEIPLHAEKERVISSKLERRGCLEPLVRASREVRQISPKYRYPKELENWERGVFVFRCWRI